MGRTAVDDNVFSPCVANALEFHNIKTITKSSRCVVITIVFFSFKPVLTYHFIF